MIVTIYDPANGRVSGVLEVSDPEVALINIPDGMLAIEGNFHPDRFYIDANHEPVAMPERPGNGRCSTMPRRRGTTPGRRLIQRRLWPRGARLPACRNPVSWSN